MADDSGEFIAAFRIKMKVVNRKDGIGEFTFGGDQRFTKTKETTHMMRRFNVKSVLCELQRHTDVPPVIQKINRHAMVFFTDAFKHRSY